MTTRGGESQRGEAKLRADSQTEVLQDGGLRTESRTQVYLFRRDWMDLLQGQRPVPGSQSTLGNLPQEGSVPGRSVDHKRAGLPSAAALLPLWTAGSQMTWKGQSHGSIQAARIGQSHTGFTEAETNQRVGLTCAQTCEASTVCRCSRGR